MKEEVGLLSQWEKLVEEILKRNPNLRFEDLSKALIRIGYSQNQPNGGSSHYTFRKDSKQPITLPKANPMNKAYIELVRLAIIENENEDD